MMRACEFILAKLLISELLLTFSVTNTQYWVIKGSKQYAVMRRLLRKHGDAQSMCNRYNAALPTPKNEIENDNLAGLPTTTFFLGMQRNIRGDWKWDTGGVVSWFNWAGWVNLTVPGGDCVIMVKGFRNTSIGHTPESWSDISCSNPAAVVCQKDVVVCHHTCNVSNKCDGPHENNCTLCNDGRQLEGTNTARRCVNCTQNKWGHKCSRACSGNCDPPNKCNNIDGHCTCTPNHHGPTCRCGKDRWGDYCRGTCSSNCDPADRCNFTNGHCACQPGWIGLRCDSPSRCPVNYTLHGYQCYRLVSEPESYDGAKAHCLADGNFLAQPKTQQEDDELGQIMTSQMIVQIWLGATDIASEEHWVWTNHTLNQTYSCWLPGRPGFDITKNCLSKTKTNTADGWMDTLCGLELAYICQTADTVVRQITTSSCNVSAFTTPSTTSDSSANATPASYSTNFATNFATVSPPPSTPCPLGKFGDKCMKDCHCKLENEPCRRTDGSCPSGCDVEWEGSGCQTERQQRVCSCDIHTCNKLGHDFTCSCNKGYRNKTPKKCVDINECADNPSLCGIHKCTNTEGSFHCTCVNDTYENIMSDLCAKKITDDPDNIKPKRFDWPKEIKAKAVAVTLSYTVMSFFVYTCLMCVKTIIGAMLRFILTKPVSSDVVFIESESELDRMIYDDLRSENSDVDVQDSQMSIQDSLQSLSTNSSEESNLSDVNSSLFSMTSIDSME